MAELSMQPVWKELPVASSADVPIIRRAVGNIALNLGFSEKRQAEVVLAASELAQNHVNFNTVKGRILISGLFSGKTSFITIFSTDHGPGINNLPQALEDGITTGNSYGNGLGTVRRLADNFSICSGSAGSMACFPELLSPEGTGTIVAASFSSDSSVLSPKITVSALACPKRGELFCGDGIYMEQSGDTLLIVLADVLGHGKEAAESVETLWDILELLDPSAELSNTVCTLDRGLAGKRGMACLFMRIDLASGMLQACSVGNIRACLHDGTRQFAIASLPGVIGQKINCRKVMVQEVLLASGTTCMIFSDGIDSSAFAARIRNSMHPLFQTYLAFKTALSPWDDASIIAWRWQKP